MHKTSSYHPQSNGVIECLHHSFKLSLCRRLTSPSWMEQLPWALLGTRSAVLEDFGCSTVDLVFHHSPLLPGELFSCPTPWLPSTTLTHHHPSTSRPPPSPLPLESSPFIYVCTNYSGPFWIHWRFPKSYEISVAGAPQWVSIN